MHPKQSPHTICNAKITQLLQNCETNQNNSPLTAFTYAEQALNEATALNCKQGMFEAAFCIANSLSNLGDYEPAYKYYLQALSIQEKYLHNKRETALLLNDIARLFRYQNNPKKIIFYLQKALNLAQQAQDSLALATTYNQIGRAYIMQQDWNEGLNYYEKSMTIRFALADSAGLLTSYNNVGFTLAKLKRYAEALVYYEKSLQVNDRFANKEMRAGTLDNIGDVYLQLGKHETALSYFSKGLETAQEVKSKTRVLESYESLVQFWTQKKDYSKALHYQKLYAILKDSLFTSNQTEQMARMEAVYHFEEQRKENDSLRNVRKLQEQEINSQKATLERQTIVIAGFLISFLFMIVIVYILYEYNRSKHIANQQLQKLNEEILSQREAMLLKTAELNAANEEILQLNDRLEKTVQERTATLEATYRELDTFLYRTSHDFRRPLTALMGISQLAQITIDDVDALDLFEKVEQTSLDMDKMIRKLQTVSEIHLNIHEQQQAVDFEKVIEKITKKFKNLLLFDKIKLQSTIQLKKTYKGGEFFIEQILENLVENSIYFHGRIDPFVSIEIKDLKDQQLLEIKVIDNGQGIAKELQSKVFDMYFRANEGSKGNGLGLYVVKNIVEKLKGSIEMQSILGSGTTFVVKLPF